MNPHETDELMVFFCSHVGGGIFGESEVGAWRASGMDAKMHCLVPLDRYWRAKSGGLARLQVRLLVIVLYSFMLKKLIASAKIGIVTNRYITFLVSPPPLICC